MSCCPKEADVLIAQHRPREAVMLFAAAQALSERLNSVVGGITFRDLVATIDALRREAWFERVWEDGHALNLNQVVEAASTTLWPYTPDIALAGSSIPASAPLTRREREVARLLAQGDTDRQIADALYLSARTVGNHVHNILEKLAFRSRVEVADWLERHGQHDDYTSTCADSADSVDVSSAPRAS